MALLASARPASAEWQFAPFFGWEFAGHTSFLDPEQASDDTHRSFGVTVTRIGRGVLGFEGTALYVPGFFNDPNWDNPSQPGKQDVITSSRAYALMGNVVVAAPLGWNEYGLRPYLSGGAGMIRADESDEPGAIDIHQHLFGLNVGGGAVGFLTNRTGLRFDLRFYSNVRNVEDVDASTVTGRKHLRFWVASVGLVFR
jgi:hypothetical protein